MLRSPEPIALTVGNFDGLHLGHRAILARLRDAARQRGLPPCVMTFEPHPREFFAPDQAPTRLTSLREKLELLAAEGIDAVYVCRFDYSFAQTSAADFIERILWRGLQVRWMLVGDDFRFGARRAGDVTMLREAGIRLGFEVEDLPSVKVGALRASSTAVREALAAGNLDAAARLLGRPYSIIGRVGHGDKLGRQLGFATANLRIQHNRPALTGIFAVEVHGLGAGDPHPGVASLGVRPTLGAGQAPLLEVHLFDFDRDIYGTRLKVDFLAKLRDEEKYPDLESLTRQIARDVKATQAFFRKRNTHHG